MFLAENIKYLREQDGLTQREFAEKLEVSSAVVGNWEQGSREPELSKIIKIAELFKVTLDELVLQELKPPIAMYALNIKFLREKHKMTQDNMAKMLGYKDKSSLCLIEKGESQLSVENLVKISDYFGVTMDQLVKKDLSKGVE